MLVERTAEVEISLDVVLPIDTCGSSLGRF